MAAVNGYSHQVLNGHSPLVATVNGHSQQKASVNGHMQQLIDSHSSQIASGNEHSEKGKKAMVSLAPSLSSTPACPAKKEPQILTLYPSSTDTQTASTTVTHHKTLLSPDTEYSNKKVRLAIHIVIHIVNCTA